MRGVEAVRLDAAADVCVVATDHFKARSAQQSHGPVEVRDEWPRTWRVQRLAWCSKCPVAMPIFFIRSRIYGRVELLGSTPSLVSASDRVRDEAAASASLSRVYGLVPMVPSAPATRSRPRTE